MGNAAIHVITRDEDIHYCRYKTYEDLQRENTELKREIEALRRRMMAFEQATSVLQDGFLLTDPNCIITDINESCCKYFEVTREYVLGKHITALVHNSKLPEVLEQRRTDVDVVHTFAEGQKSSGERMLVVSRLAVMNGDEMIGGAAFLKFSGYTQKVVKTLYDMGQELDYYRKELIRHSIDQWSFDNLPSGTESFREAKLMADRFAKCDLPILLLGETGVGKEVFANAIHLASDRRYGPFVSVNCTSIPAELLEAELFGYEGGSFTGGKPGGRRGKFELADNGVLFLDEVGDMPMSMQVKLLRVLQDNCIEKIGSEKPLRVDVRIITATNQNLERKIELKEFREDLYYRLNVLPIQIPALRERIEDIPTLAQVFLDELNQRYCQNFTIAPQTMRCLQSYSWPGNIRELKNVMGRMFMMTYDGKVILPEKIPQYILTAINANEEQLFTASSEKEDREHILRVLQKHNFNCAKTAKMLGIHRGTLYTKLRRYSIDISQLRDGDS